MRLNIFHLLALVCGALALVGSNSKWTSYGWYQGFSGWISLLALLAVVFVLIHAKVRTRPFVVVATVAGSLAAIFSFHDLRYLPDLFPPPATPGWGLYLAMGSSVGLSLAALALVFLGSEILSAESSAGMSPEIVMAASPSPQPAETSSHARLITGLGIYSLVTGLLGLMMLGMMLISVSGSGNGSLPRPLGFVFVLISGLLGLMPVSGPLAGVVGLSFALSMPRSDWRRRQAVALSAAGTAAWALIIGCVVLFLLTFSLTF